MQYKIKITSFKNLFNKLFYILIDEYNKHYAMIAYKKYLYLTVPLIIIDIIIRRMAFKGEPLGDKGDKVEYTEPNQEWVDNFKLKIKKMMLLY